MKDRLFEPFFFCNLASTWASFAGLIRWLCIRSYTNYKARNWIGCPVPQRGERCVTSKRWLRRRLFLKSRPLHSKRNVFKNWRRNKDVKSHGSHWGQLGWRKEAYNVFCNIKQPGTWLDEKSFSFEKSITWFPPPQDLSGIPSYTPPWGAMTLKSQEKTPWHGHRLKLQTTLAFFISKQLKRARTLPTLYGKENSTTKPIEQSFFHDTCKIQSSYLFQFKYHLLNPLHSFFITTKMCITSQQL